MRDEPIVRGVLPIAVVLTLLSFGPCLGWGDDGHRIVCEIAWLELSKEARAGVLDVLAEGEPPERYFNGSCTWADRVRGEERYEGDVARHFVNGKRGDDRLRLPCKGPCVVEGIETYEGILRKEILSAERSRSEALKFLSHFVGDVHQPLHAAYEDDRGGNLTAVRYNGEDRDSSGRPYNLHRVWDTLMIRAVGKSPQDYAEDLHREITAAEREEWTSTMSPGDWAGESFALSRQVYETLDGAEVGRDYQASHIGTVERRLKQAGVRLARLLEEIF